MVVDFVRSDDGTRIAYEVSGSGPLLIIVNGALSTRGAGVELSGLLGLLKGRDAAIAPRWRPEILVRSRRPAESRPRINLRGPPLPERRVCVRLPRLRRAPAVGVVSSSASEGPLLHQPIPLLSGGAAKVRNQHRSPHRGHRLLLAT